MTMFMKRTLFMSDPLLSVETIGMLLTKLGKSDFSVKPGSKKNKTENQFRNVAYFL